MAILLIMIPVHADVNAKPSGHRRTSHVAGKTGGDGKHLSAGKADAKVSATVMTTIDAVGPKAGKGGWTRVLRIGAWGVIVVAGMMLVAQRLKDRFLALEHGRVRIGERVDALKRAIATGRQRAETAEARVKMLETDAESVRREAQAARRRIVELEQDNAQLRADRTRAVEIEQLFTKVRVELDEMARTRGQAEPEHARSTLDQHLALLQAAEPGALIPSSVLNYAEQSKFRAILTWTKERKLKLLPQVSMGEYLEPSPGEEELRWTYNDRRADFVICDEQWMPILAVEHHGSGHQLGENWEKRDAIKAQALVLADIGLVITEDGDRKDIVRAKLDAEYARLTAESATGRRALPAQYGRGA
ncbi:DUF2726 domain-containing protein [Caulobacter sp. FWC26]|uniref:DUF2726 domain-containing protein n=1 Tax=Caulobacter sp. FWC26 TaxID=69665 RepID=UPI00143CF2C8|nr:DUF2726 domain-containing protein [Caulobacter sp. FWC26]